MDGATVDMDSFKNLFKWMVIDKDELEEDNKLVFLNTCVWRSKKYRVYETTANNHLLNYFYKNWTCNTNIYLGPFI